MNDYRPIKTKIFIKFLVSKGCYKVKNKSTGSHSYYKRSNLARRIVIREADKEIPALHIRTNLKTLELQFSDLQEFIDKN